MLYRTVNPHGGDTYGQNILLDYSANTNPFGTPKGVLDAVSAALPQVHRYPDPYCRELVGAIAEYEQVLPRWILCGNGAAELIYAFCDAVKPQRAVELAPTFSEYSAALQRCGAEIYRYALEQKRDFQPGEDLIPFLREVRPDVIFLCNPNNPTGQLMDPQLLEKVLSFCRDSGTRLLLDECFLDLSEGGTSLKDKLADFPQFLILKAFTKSFGMAGIRLGYCLCADDRLLAAMSSAAQPWNVSSLAQAAGAAALKEGDFLEKTREVVFQERRWLSQQLKACGFWVCPGSANYIFFRGPENLHTALQELGIAIRNCENYVGLSAGWYRIAVRRHSENEVLTAAIRQVTEER